MTRICVIRTMPLPKSPKSGTYMANWSSTTLLRDFRVRLDVAALGRLNVIFQLIPRNLRIVHPLIEEPVKLPISLQVHLLGHVLFGDGFEPPMISIRAPATTAPEGSLIVRKIVSARSLVAAARQTRSKSREAKKARRKSGVALPLLLVGITLTTSLRLRSLRSSRGVLREGICMVVDPRLPILNLYTNLTASSLLGQSQIFRCYSFWLTDCRNFVQQFCIKPLSFPMSC